MLYLYDNIWCGENCCVLRSSKSSKPAFSAENCRPFHNEEHEIIKMSVPDRTDTGKYPGWIRLNVEGRERVLMGMNSEGVDVKIISDWRVT